MWSMSVRILKGDTRDVLRELEDCSVHCCVSSPPYFGLRSYLPDGHPDKAKEIGLEQTPAEYVEQMVQVFREVRRVLRDDGTLWINLGDSYSSGGNGPGAISSKQSTNRGANLPPKRTPGFGPKQLLGIPWRTAFALQSDGWWLRQDIVWGKQNPLPESVTDRCTKSHEYVFLLAKSERYFFNAAAIAETAAAGRPSGNKSHKYVDAYSAEDSEQHRNKAGLMKVAATAYATRNKRSVWTIATQPFGEAHFATMPPALAETCILAGCPERGTVLDPFGGAGTTGLVADRLNRNAILIELNSEYVELARRRIQRDAPLFAEVAAE
jgi:DNA modification methylase